MVTVGREPGFVVGSSGAGLRGQVPGGFSRAGMGRAGALCFGCLLGGCAVFDPGLGGSD